MHTMVSGLWQLNSNLLTANQKKLWGQRSEFWVLFLHVVVLLLVSGFVLVVVLPLLLFLSFVDVVVLFLSPSFFVYVGASLGLGSVIGSRYGRSIWATACSFLAWVGPSQRPTALAAGLVADADAKTCQKT